MIKMRMALLLFFTLLSGTVYATQVKEEGLQLVLDEHRVGADVNIKEDEDEVYAAVQNGLIKPFSELYKTIDLQLNGRLIKVELDEERNQWVYELKLIHESNVIKVEYDAASLEIIKIEGRDLINIIKNRAIK